MNFMAQEVLKPNQNIEKLKCVNTFGLKLFAIIVMTIDHVGSVIGTDRNGGYFTYSSLIPENVYMILRSIGRMAFPIFCYLIVEGFFYTRSVLRYALRLTIFAAISQLPYGIACRKQPFSLENLNVFFTLALGLICVAIVDKCIEKCKANEKYGILYIVLGIVSSFLIMYAAERLHTDYGQLGIIIILSFYLFRNKHIYQFIAIGYATYLLEPGIQILSLFALIPIWMHNRKKGPGLKYFFYLYYPLHLMLLYFIFEMLI